MNSIFIILAIPFAISFLLSLYITQRMRIISYNGNVYLGQRRKEIVGMEIGGLSLFPIMLISMCFSLALPQSLRMEDISRQVEPATMRILQMIVGCAFLYIMGVKDDFHGTGTANKFFVLFFAAAMFPASDLWINDLHGIFGIHDIPIWIGIPITLLAAMFLTELPAITDSPDGLATGIGTLLVALFLLLSIFGNHALSTIIASVTFGATLPFTICKKFDKRWEKTHMGSSGNYILGYILSYLAIGLIRQCGGRLPEEAIIICIGIIFVPLLDAIRVLKNRILENRDILKPDKNQIQHLLIRTGMPEKYVSLTITLIILSFALFNLLSIYCGIGITIIFFIDILVWGACSFFINWRIARHETIYTHEKWNKE